MSVVVTLHHAEATRCAGPDRKNGVIVAAEGIGGDEGVGRGRKTVPDAFRPAAAATGWSGVGGISAGPEDVGRMGEGQGCDGDRTGEGVIRGRSHDVKLQ